MTARIYQNDVYVKNWDAVIQSVDTLQEDGTTRILLDRTAFFPEGGGQSCDIGTIEWGEYTWTVCDVQESSEPEKDEIIHTILCDQNLPLPKAGQQVHCHLDWERRFDNMQRHCGEHILSGAFHSLTGAVNRGFHMGSDYMTIDMSLEDEPTAAGAKKPVEITMETALTCELQANQVIWSNLPVSVSYFQERAEAEAMPLRKALAFDEDISIVTIGDPASPADCVACCGTHPALTGQVGLIKIYKVENYKGMFRIYFDAGKRALLSCRREHEVVSSIANRYSSSIDDLPAALHAQEEKLASAKDQLHQLKKALIDRECASLDAALSEGSTSQGTRQPLLWELEDLSSDDAFDMAKRYMKKSPRLILLYARKNTSFILVSSIPAET